MAEQASGYSFPDAPAGAEEWSGTPLRGSTSVNCITRLKGRTQQHDKTLDDRPVERDELLRWAHEHTSSLGAAARVIDVVVHGVRVRAITNSDHMAAFFEINWFSPDEWLERTGFASPEEPQLVAYALNGVAGRKASAFYSRQRGTVLFINTSYYGQLKSWVLGAVGRLLAEERGIHSVHGACVQVGHGGILYVAPTGTGKSTSSYGLMTLPGSRFHSDDWVYIRYAVPAGDGQLIAPTTFHLQGRTLEGDQAVAAMLARRPIQGTYEGYRLTGERVSGQIADLDLTAKLTAHAYTSEKVFYLRTNLVESFPLAARGLMSAPLENVPDVTANAVEAETKALLTAAQELADGQAGAVNDYLHDLTRLVAFDNARAMLDAHSVFGKDRTVWNPLEPVQLTAVFLLERDFKTRRVLEPSSEDQFLGNLFYGETPTGTHETAYNAYRAVDDAAERRIIDAWPANRVFAGGVYQQICQSANVPSTLVAEATLFKAMYASARCFSLNTILQADPQVTSRAEAVARTLRIIVQASQGHLSRPLTLDTYEPYLGPA